MRLTKAQRGLSFISAMVLMILVGFVAIFVIKLVPAYIENLTVRSVLESFKTEPTSYASAWHVQDALKKRFDVNSIRGVSADDVEVQPAPGGYNLRLDYEVQVPFVGNISLVTKFSETGHANGGSGAQ